jgi:hypothetical protein
MKAVPVTAYAPIIASPELPARLNTVLEFIQTLHHPDVRRVLFLQLR